MKVIRDFGKQIAKKYPLINECNLTIGNFESIHLGHLKLLESLKKNEKNKKVLISFEPSPNAYFLKTNQKIYGIKQKIKLLSDHLDYLILLRFNQNLAHLSADDFLIGIKKYLNPSHISIGDDFCFGKNRAGNSELMSVFCKQNHISFYQLPTFSKSNEKSNHNNQQTIRFSTSLVREKLQNYDFLAVKQILGRAYSLEDKVRKGRQLARKIGTPTANIKLNFTPIIFGVFAVRVHIKNKGIFNHNAIANLGIKPTICNENRYYLEVHLLNDKNNEFDLYGENLEVEFIQFIRSEQKFASLEKLQNQIQKDIKQARKILKQVG